MSHSITVDMMKRIIGEDNYHKEYARIFMYRDWVFEDYFVKRDTKEIGRILINRARNDFRFKPLKVNERGAVRIRDFDWKWHDISYKKLISQYEEWDDDD